MRLSTLARRASDLVVALAEISQADAVAIAARTEDADGPAGDAARALSVLRDRLNALGSEPPSGVTRRGVDPEANEVFPPEQARQLEGLLRRVQAVQQDLEGLRGYARLCMAATAEGSRGPVAKPVRDLMRTLQRLGVTPQPDAQLPDMGTALRLYRTTDGRIFDRPEQADDHSVHQDDRGLDVLRATVTSVRPLGERPSGDPA